MEYKEIYEDTSPMPFGKYKGMALANVPASYLIWLYEQDNFKKSLDTQRVGLRIYIRDNMDVLKAQINQK